MERESNFITDHFYHIYNRGVNKQPIFNNDSDYKRFQELLYTRNGTKPIKSDRVQGLSLDKVDRGEPIVFIVAYVLMPNHFHILIREKQEGGISTFMSKLCTAYSMYMNIKYDRTGPLVCRPFRSKYIDTDEYLRWVISYIHLNPLELLPTKTMQALLDYSYSSYADYYGRKRTEALILNTEQLPFDAVELESIASMREVLEEEVQSV